MKINLDPNDIPFTDLHMHTIYSDGCDSPSDMLKSAAGKGLKVIGISDHSYTFFDESYCIKRDRFDEYLGILFSLREKCSALKDNPRFAKALGSSDIRFYAGIEQDYYSTFPSDAFDYVIGSVHYIRLPIDGREIPEGCLTYDRHVYIPVDESADILKRACEAFYGGDIYSLIEDYFLIEGDVINRTGADIIGHFDLIYKFNEDGSLFDPDNERYKNAWQKAALELLKTGALFEINTGAISRGVRTSPYPSSEMIRFIKDNNGNFIFSSDAHRKENIAFGFERLSDYVLA